MVDAVKLLSELLEIIAKEQNYNNPKVTVTPTSSGNANYTTELYVASISSPNRAELKLFGKVAVFSEEFRKTALKTYYDTEFLFYTKLAKTFEAIQDEHNVSEENRLFLPKFYGCNNKFLEETIVLEDLTANGFTSYDRFKSADWEYASKSVKEIAKLHALSVAYSVQNPKEFDEIIKNLKFTIPAERASFKKLCDGWFAGALEVTKEEYKERFKKFMEKFGDMEKTPQFYKPLLRAAITHGDFKITNLLHKVRDDGSIQIAVLDYQTLRVGSMPSDLIYFIFTSTDQEFRRKYYHELVEFYYSQLQLALRRLGVDETVYPKEDFDYEMKMVLPYGLTVAVYVLLVLMVRDEDAPTVGGEDDLTTFAMKPNQQYGARLNEILEEYVEWGVL